VPKILEKIAEEAGELAESLPQDDRKHTTHEAMDISCGIAASWTRD